MSAEFIVKFKDPDWYSRNLKLVEKEIRKLPTFVGQEQGEFRLLGVESRTDPGRWSYDVRMFIGMDPQIRMDVSAHPESIEKDLSHLFSWLRSQTSIVVEDEDGVASAW